MNLRKLWPALGLMCMSVISTANADTYNSRSDSMSSSQNTKSGTYERGTYREITPNAGPRVAAGADVFLTADFIYWGTEVSATSYAEIGLPVPGATVLTNASRGSDRHFADTWSAGFKVGIGLNLSHDGWDLYAQYTWLRPSNSSSISSLTDFIINPLLEVEGLSSELSNVERATASWNFDLNVIDLELGRNFYLSQFLTMRPFIGLKATWQDNDYTVKYFTDGDFTHQTVTDLEGPYRIRRDDDIWGIGVRGGFNVAWYMAKSWSIYGDLAWTAMWNDYDLDKKESIENPTAEGNGISPVTYNVHRGDFHSVNHIFEVELGLRWQIWFNDDNYHFSLQAGWEEQIWINWINTGINNWNDISFHGLNLKARFDF